MLVKLIDRFSSKTLSPLKGNFAVYSNSADFLHIDAVDEFSCDIDKDSNVSKSELVIRFMTELKKINNVIQFLMN